MTWSTLLPPSELRPSYISLKLLWFLVPVQSSGFLFLFYVSQHCFAALLYRKTFVTLLYSALFELCLKPTKMSAALYVPATRKQDQNGNGWNCVDASGNDYRAQQRYACGKIPKLTAGSVECECK